MIPWWAVPLVVAIVSFAVGFVHGAAVRRRDITLAQARKRIQQDIDERDSRF